MTVTETLFLKRCRDAGYLAGADPAAPGRFRFYSQKTAFRGEFRQEADGSWWVTFNPAAFRGWLEGQRGGQPLDPEDSGFWWDVAEGEAAFAALDPDKRAVIEDDPYDPRHDNEAQTEADRTAKVRRGQETYRRRLEDLWGGACAVTGVAIPELLRASHAKPWAECETGAERLSRYNGFLLTANLDALFDKFLISFDEEGEILISPGLDRESIEAAGIRPGMRLRKLLPGHAPFLAWHRTRFWEKASKT